MGPKGKTIKWRERQKRACGTASVKQLNGDRSEPVVLQG